MKVLKQSFANINIRDNFTQKTGIGLSERGMRLSQRGMGALLKRDKGLPDYPKEVVADYAGGRVEDSLKETYDHVREAKSDTVQIITKQ